MPPRAPQAEVAAEQARAEAARKDTAEALAAGAAARAAAAKEVSVLREQESRLRAAIRKLKAEWQQIAGKRQR